MTTATHIVYLHLCHRKLWLFAHGIQMEHRSELVAEGKLIGETSYDQRADRWQEIALEGIKIDHFDPQKGIVREVKKSSKQEHTHIAQLKYYLFVLERNGIRTSHGLLEYPKEKQTKEVRLTDEDRQQIPNWEAKVQQIVAQAIAPMRLQRSKCRNCSYEELCWIEGENM